MMILNSWSKIPITFSPTLVFLVFLLSLVSVFALYNNWVFYIFRCSTSACIYMHIYLQLFFLTGKLTLLPLCFSLSLVTVLNIYSVWYSHLCSFGHYLHGISFSISSLSAYIWSSIWSESPTGSIQLDLIFVFFSRPATLCLFIGSLIHLNLKSLLIGKDLLLLSC